MAGVRHLLALSGTSITIQHCCKVINMEDVVNLKTVFHSYLALRCLYLRIVCRRHVLSEEHSNTGFLPVSHWQTLRCASPLIRETRRMFMQQASSSVKEVLFFFPVNYKMTTEEGC